MLIQGSNLCLLRLLQWQAGSSPAVAPGKPPREQVYLWLKKKKEEKEGGKKSDGEES